MRCCTINTGFFLPRALRRLIGGITTYSRTVIIKRGGIRVQAGTFLGLNRCLSFGVTSNFVDPESRALQSIGCDTRACHMSIVGVRDLIREPTVTMVLYMLEYLYVAYIKRHW